MNLKSRSLRIGLAWQTLTSENLGVAALAEANLAIVRTAAHRAGINVSCIEFCPTGPNIQLAASRQCEIAAPLSPKKMMLGRSAYSAQLRACDVLLDIGAGDSFSDLYGKKHFFFLGITKLLSIVTGVPLILSPQTIGPFESRSVARVAAWLMSRANHVFARDHQSMAYLQTLGITTNATEAIDVAFRLPFEPRGKAGDGRTHVGVNVSGLLFHGGYTRNNQFGLKVDYPGLIRELLSVLSSRTDVQVHLLGHVLSRTFEVEDDHRVCQALQAEFPKVLVAPWFESPSEAKSYISGLDFFTGARMHACIGAFSSGVPVVPMAYSRKFNGLFGSLGYPHIADLKSDDNATALAKVLDGLDRRDALAEQVALGNASAVSRLQAYEDYLADLFGRLHGRKH